MPPFIRAFHLRSFDEEVGSEASTLQGLMDKVEEYIHQEETLKAMANSRPSQDRSPNRKG
jgi:hypothetical protein